MSQTSSLVLSAASASCLPLFKEPLGSGEFLRAQESGGIEFRDRVATEGLLFPRLASQAQSWIDGESISWAGSLEAHMFPTCFLGWGNRTFGRLTWGRSVNPWENTWGIVRCWDLSFSFASWSWDKQLALPHASTIHTATAQAVQQQLRAVASPTLDQNFQKL